MNGESTRKGLSNNSRTDEILERVQETVKRKALTSKATVVGAKHVSPWADTEVCPYKKMRIDFDGSNTAIDGLLDTLVTWEEGSMKVKHCFFITALLFNAGLSFGLDPEPAGTSKTVATTKEKESGLSIAYNPFSLYRPFGEGKTRELSGVVLGYRLTKNHGVELLSYEGREPKSIRADMLGYLLMYPCGRFIPQMGLALGGGRSFSGTDSSYNAVGSADIGLDIRLVSRLSLVLRSGVKYVPDGNNAHELLYGGEAHFAWMLAL